MSVSTSAIAPNTPVRPRTYSRMVRTFAPLRLCVRFFFFSLGSSSLPVPTTVKSATMKVMNAEAVAVEMVPSVVMIVMPSAEDKVAAAVWASTAVIWSKVRTSGIASRVVQISVRRLDVDGAAGKYIPNILVGAVDI